MIGGTPVLGYAFADLNDAQVKGTIEPFELRLKSATQTFAQRIEALLAAVRDAIVALKKQEKASKDGLEVRKDKRLGELAGDAPILEEKRRDYLLKEYVPELRGLGMSLQRVETAIKNCKAYKDLSSQVNSFPAPVKVPSGEMVVPLLEVRDGKLTLGWKPNQKKATPIRTTTLVELLLNDTAYVEVAGGAAATPRQVYRKKTFDKYYSGAETEYVKDDDGVFTRRYGYASKDEATLKMLFGDGVLRGKYAKGKPLPDSTDKLARDPNIFKKLPKEKDQLPKIGDTADMSLRQMLHVHQELGSGDSQRGICLAMTPRRNMVSNQGIAFAGITIKVDLAKVPTGKELLYNLYRPEAQAKAEATTIRKKVNDKVTDFADTQHMLDSVSKNREVFLRVLLPDFLDNKDEVKKTLGIK